MFGRTPWTSDRLTAKSCTTASQQETHETRAYVSVPCGARNRYPSARSVRTVHASEGAAQCDQHGNHVQLTKTTAFETRLLVSGHASKLNNVLNLNDKRSPCKTVSAGLRAYKCLKYVEPVRQELYHIDNSLNPLKPELNPICYLLALLGAHHFLHVSRIRVKSLTFGRLMSYIYGAPVLDVSRSHTTTQHSR